MITKKDVRGIVLEATDTILEGVQNMFDQQNKLNDEKFATKTDLNKVEQKLSDQINGLSVKADKLDDTVDGIKADISTAPTRKEFNGLKSRMDKFSLS